MINSTLIPLDLRLEADSTFVIDLDLCQVRLNHNAAFPWILLIPQQENVFEIIDLSPSHQQQLMQEICLASSVMKSLFQPTKLNVACLGNIVPQLHIHIVARYENDKAWPEPVWNSGVNVPYDPKVKIERISQMGEALIKVCEEL